MIQIEMKDPAQPMTVVNVRVMVPLLVHEVKSLVCSDNKAREMDVRKHILVGDVCVCFDDLQTYSRRILHCRSGKLVPGYYADYLLFEYGLTVHRIVIAKPEN